jgi:hypothetical protein
MTFQCLLEFTIQCVPNFDCFVRRCKGSPTPLVRTCRSHQCDALLGDLQQLASHLPSGENFTLETDIRWPTREYFNSYCGFLTSTLAAGCSGSVLARFASFSSRESSLPVRSSGTFSWSIMWNAVVFALVPDFLAVKNPLAVTLSISFSIAPADIASSFNPMWFALQSQGKLLTAIVQDKVSQ